MTHLIPLLEFTFQSFMHFIGVLILLGGIGNFLTVCFSRLMRCLMIRKHGWPPSHLDADGDPIKDAEE